MSKPIVYQTTHRIRFSDLDPYDHVSTAKYATYFVDHRMAALARYVGWDAAALRSLPFMLFVRRLEIDFLRPARSDQEITITSFVKSVAGTDVLIECTMAGADGKPLARCLMTVAHVDRATNRASDWPPDLAALFFEPAGG